MNLEEIIQQFRAQGYECRWTGTEWRCQCPAHPEPGRGQKKDRNLALAPGRNGGIVVTCHSHDCKVFQVAPAVGLKVADFGPQPQPGNGIARDDAVIYPYRNEKGEPLFEVVRGADKQFWQRLPGAEKGGIGNVERVLFGLPELLKSKPGDLIAICEGEKDALAVAHLGICATTNPGGAGRWKQEHTDWLKAHLPGRRFIVLPDNDEPGRKHGIEVYESLRRAGLDVAVVELPGLPDKGDAFDWIKAGGTGEKLRVRAAAAAVQAPVV